ncbi:hypothetical protein GCM10028803_45620 [Larkinella knui]
MPIQFYLIESGKGERGPPVTVGLKDLKPLAIVATQSIAGGATQMKPCLS